MNLRMLGLAWSLGQPAQVSGVLADETLPQDTEAPQAPPSVARGTSEERDASPSGGDPSSDAASLEAPAEGTPGTDPPVPEGPSEGPSEGTRTPEAPPAAVEYQEVEVPRDVRGVIERVTGEQLETHALDPSELGVVIRWRDRDSMLYEIAIRVGDTVDDGSKLTAACLQCSGDELAQHTLALLELAIAELKERAARQAPPPPVVVSPGAFQLADTPREPTKQGRRWPVRRGLAAGLVAAGAAATVSGIVLSALPDRKVILDETFFYRTFINYDYRTPGLVTLGIGAAALVGGAVWLALEQRRAPKRSRARKQARITPGVTGWEVTF